MATLGLRHSFKPHNIIARVTYLKIPVIYRVDEEHRSIFELWCCYYLSFESAERRSLKRESQTRRPLRYIASRLIPRLPISHVFGDACFAQMVELSYNFKMARYTTIINNFDDLPRGKKYCSNPALSLRNCVLKVITLRSVYKIASWGTLRKIAHQRSLFDKGSNFVSIKEYNSDRYK